MFSIHPCNIPQSGYISVLLVLYRSFSTILRTFYISHIGLYLDSDIAVCRFKPQGVEDFSHFAAIISEVLPGGNHSQVKTPGFEYKRARGGEEFCMFHRLKIKNPYHAPIIAPRGGDLHWLLHYRLCSHLSVNESTRIDKSSLFSQSLPNNNNLMLNVCH